MIYLLLRINYVCINISVFVSDSDTKKKPYAVVGDMHSTVEVKTNHECCLGSNSSYLFCKIYTWIQANKLLLGTESFIWKFGIGGTY